MNFDLTDDQKMLGEQARRLLTERVGYDTLRTLINEACEIDAPLWKMVADLGWLAIAIPEEYGGLGLGLLEQCVIAEELGRHVASLPFISSVGLCAELIRLAGSEPQQAEWLPRLASGERIAAFAYHEGTGPPDPRQASAFGTRVVCGRLTGRKWPVIDGGVATLLVVAANGVEGPGLYLVDGVDGVQRTKMPGFDQLRAGYAIDFENANTERLAGDFAAAVHGAVEQAAVLTAFEQVGGAEAALYMGRDYSLERKAFGRAIGSYQAIKHKLADMLTKIELARSNCYYAGWAATEGVSGREVAAAVARLSAIEAYEFAARENVQVHGGIGFTWEANCHFHYRRSRLLAVSLGAARYWSDRVIDGLASIGQGEAA